MSRPRNLPAPKVTSSSSSSSSPSSCGGTSLFLSSSSGVASTVIVATKLGFDRRSKRLKVPLARWAHHVHFSPRFQSSQIHPQRRMERELRLREHIRGLLLDYCRAHITEDYVTFTQDAVQTVSPLSHRFRLPLGQSFLMSARTAATIRQDRARTFGGSKLHHPTCRPARCFASGFGHLAHPGREMEGRRGCSWSHTEINEPWCYVTGGLEVLA